MLVTVLIPTYNYGHYILDAIKSIEQQIYPLHLIEVVIIDDGSTDNTQSVLAAYDCNLTIRYYYQENKGKAIATQLGIIKSNGEIIFNLDADDYFLPNKINEIISIYSLYPDVVSVGHPAIIVYEKSSTNEVEKIPNEITNKLINGLNQLEFFLEKRMLFGGGSTFSARALNLKTILMSPSVDMYIDEYLIFATYAQGTTYLLNSHLSVWRVHGNNYSVNKSADVSFLKINRMIMSSVGMLDFIKESNNLSNRIKKLYFLKHLDRYYTSLEVYNNKSIIDIIKLAQLLITGKYRFKDLNNYRLFNRLIPTFIIKKLKLITKAH